MDSSAVINPLSALMFSIIGKEHTIKKMFILIFFVYFSWFDNKLNQIIFQKVVPLPEFDQALGNFFIFVIQQSRIQFSMLFLNREIAACLTC